MSRPLNLDELRLVNALLAGAPEGWRPTIPPQELMVRDMDDGGMGSLRIGRADTGRRFGRELVEGWYLDDDDMPISVSMNLDQFGELFEVDSWKVDFSKRIRLPSRIGDVRLGPMTKAVLARSFDDRRYDEDADSPTYQPSGSVAEWPSGLTGSKIFNMAVGTSQNVTHEVPQPEHDSCLARKTSGTARRHECVPGRSLRLR